MFKHTAYLSLSSFMDSDAVVIWGPREYRFYGGWMGHTVFKLDAVLEDGKWKRTLTLIQNRNDPSPPEMWELELINPIPSAISLEK